MNSLEYHIKEFCIYHFDQTNDWYRWRKINESKIPQNIKISGRNQFEKNISLKKELHKHWIKNKEPIKKGDLIEYYIKDWGGIRGNKPDTMYEYRMKSSQELIAKGKKGIASWSKALVVHNPLKYAIYDARVAVSINSLQIINELKEKTLFPVLSSQNRKIRAANKKLKIISKKGSWQNYAENEFYKNYLKILSCVSGELKTNISKVEMLLFSKVEELIKESGLI